MLHFFLAKEVYKQAGGQMTNA